MRPMQLENQRFGSWTVIRRVENNKCGQTRWECKCDCGKISNVVGVNLVQGLSKSCGCQNSRFLPTGVAAQNKVYRVYKRNAATRNILFSLSKDEASSLFQGSCHYCGAGPSNLYSDNVLNGTYRYNGIDRVDNTKGYTLENCVSCCFICNHAKSTMSVVDFLNWITRVYKHTINPEPFMEQT